MAAGPSYAPANRRGGSTRSLRRCAVVVVGGGLVPGCRLGLEERWEIRRGLVAGVSLRAVAAVLGRPVSTVAREVARHGGREGYRPVTAQRRAWRLARRPKPFKLVSNGPLGREVAAR